MRDMFGNELVVGMYVIFADYAEDDTTPQLALYQLTQVLPGEVIGKLASGDYFYLSDPDKRVVVVGSDQDVYQCARYYSTSTRN